MSLEQAPTLKVLLVGPSGAGKSALMTRYVSDLFDSENSTATIGVEYKFKMLSVHGTPYQLNILDTAGQERFRALSKSYYRNAHGILLVFDLSSRDSFRSMEDWFGEVYENTKDEVVKILVGTKLDRPRRITSEAAAQLAAKHGVRYCEVSSKTRENVKTPFLEVVDSIVSSPVLMERIGMQNQAVLVSEPTNTESWISGSLCAC